ncbi:MAG: Nif3-like dinuclear metal center hexameric protein [Verrucomicrobiota bacterium]
MSVALDDIVSDAESLLDHKNIVDWSGAKNGLQVANNGVITKIGAAVDVHTMTIEKAIEEQVDFLIVHHGLFWNDITPIVDTSYLKLKLLLDHNVALFSSHLPLDLHPTIGNNAIIARKLGLKSKSRFGQAKGQTIGFRGTLSLTRSALVTKLAEILGHKPTLLAGGPENIKQIGVVSGGAGNDLIEAAEDGLDTFISGEGSHWTFGAAMDHGINVIYGGHYATEVFGVQALADKLSKKFRLPCTFISCPSGL